MTATSTVDSNPASSVYAALNAKSGAKTGTGNTTEIEDRFLKLLITQLKNQDPLNPLDNAQMTSQMAQISTVNGIEKLNATVQALMGSSTQTQTMQASTLLGKGVLVPGSAMDVRAADGPAVAGFELAAPADGATVTINDANGVTVRTLTLGGMDAGVHPFQWDGKSTSGTVVADGTYTFNVAAKRGPDKVESTALQFGMVTSITNGTKGIGVNVGSLGSFAMKDVKEIL